VEVFMAERQASVPITVVFTAEQAAELRAIAEQEHRSLSRQVQHLVSRGLAAEYEPADAE
jgi:hypothetical protein